ncbi:DGQHR domain-containing protein [Bosea sp. AAP35]|uniref:DGQHR domain-containing protein n=1 Tax=Bosea sp. AAP35 TaxID=1523417 RepID=UPI000A792C06|nr:DGQHR domain-containing protein [Bosea sp. AAP35]
MPAAKPQVSRKSKIPLTPEQKEKKEAERKAKLRKAQHIRMIRETFVSAGFKHINDLSSSNFVFNGRETDLDEVFLIDNVLVLLEHTSHDEDHVSAHLVNKSIIYNYMNGDRASLVSDLKSKFNSIDSGLHKKYHDHDIQVRIVYCSRKNIKQSTKDHVKGVHFLDYPQLKYFSQTSKAVKLSVRYELLDFLGVYPSQFGDNVLSSGGDVVATLRGTVLPESQSHLPPDYKVVSFYISAGELIRRAYVLRRDSWRDDSDAYQRFLIKKKIDLIRRHLLAKKGVFLNNIIAILPDSTEILSEQGLHVNPKDLVKVTPAKIHLTEQFNSISIIDGQHRVFSYYEGGADEEKISILRGQQNLLVTGVILPDGASAKTRDRFSAGLFLQINSNQTKPPPELIQDIGVILRPFEVSSMARRVLWKLNSRGPFRDKFQAAFSEGDTIRTASVVLYGLVPLIRPGSDESLYKHWSDASKDDLVKGVSDSSVDENIISMYVEYCTVEINKFIGAVKVQTGRSRWTASRKHSDRLLTTTIVNGMLHCLRRISSVGNLRDHDNYKSALEHVNSFEFTNYTSSHYNQLGLDMAKKYFDM